jgi:hypothetical protein
MLVPLGGSVQEMGGNAINARVCKYVKVSFIDNDGVFYARLDAQGTAIRMERGARNAYFTQ